MTPAVGRFGGSAVGVAVALLSAQPLNRLTAQSEGSILTALPGSTRAAALGGAGAALVGDPASLRDVGEGDRELPAARRGRRARPGNRDDRRNHEARRDHHCRSHPLTRLLPERPDPSRGARRVVTPAPGEAKPIAVVAPNIADA